MLQFRGLHSAVMSRAVLLLCAGCALAAEPVPLKDGRSPDQRFEVCLEADKDTPSFAKYQFKGGEENFPAFVVREIKTGKILSRFGYPSDPHSDKRPLREKVSVSWHPDSQRVFMNSRERFYTATTVVAYHAKEKEFKWIPFPSYEKLTGFPDPPRRHLRPRCHSISVAWTKAGTLIHELGYSPMPSYKGKDPLLHRIELKVAATGMTVVKRTPLARR